MVSANPDAATPTAAGPPGVGRCSASAGGVKTGNEGCASVVAEGSVVVGGPGTAVAGSVGAAVAAISAPRLVVLPRSPGAAGVAVAAVWEA